MVVLIITAVFSIALFAGAFMVLSRANPNLRGVRRLERELAPAEQPAGVSIVRDGAMSKSKLFNRILTASPGTESLRLLLRQADLSYSVGLCVLLSAVFALIGLLFGSQRGIAPAILMTGLGAAAPFIYVFTRRRKRVARFEELLPDALELLARALRAGHSFGTGVQIVSEEMADPVGKEFRKVYSEISYGTTNARALENLSKRVACNSLKFLAAAVALQQASGGNLAELLESIANVIRQRLKLQARIKALSAEGKFSAIALIAMPVGLAIILSLFTDHLDPLFTEPAGRKLLAGTAVLLCIGVITIRKIVRIKV